MALAEGEAKLRTWETRLEGEAEQLRVQTERFEIERADLAQQSQDAVALLAALDARESELNRRDAENDERLAEHRVECEAKLAQAQAEGEAKLAQRQAECEAKLTQRELELLRAWAEFEAAVASEEHQVRGVELDERERAIAGREAELTLLHNRLAVAARDLRIPGAAERLAAEASPHEDLASTEQALEMRRNRLLESEERITAAEHSIAKRLYELERQEERLENREAKLAAHGTHALYP